jgi:hypothetical protein
VKADGIANVSVTTGASTTAIDLSKSFADTEDGATGLTYSVLTNTNTILVNPTVAGQYLNVEYSSFVKSGTADITIRATDKGGLYADAKFTVTVVKAKVNPPVTLQVGTVNQGATTITLKIGGMTESAPLTYEIVGNGYKITYKGTVYIVTKNGTQGFSVGALTAAARDNETRDSSSMLIMTFDKPVLSVSASASDNGGGSTFSAYDADNNLLKTVLVTGSTPTTYTISGVGEISKVIFASTGGWIGNLAYSVNVIPGDINLDFNADLADAILMLQVLSDIELPDVVYPQLSISGTRIGLEDVIINLQQVAGLR